MDLRNFKKVPTEFLPAPFWSWNDKLEIEELIRQVDEMAEKGWGSSFMHSRVGLVTGYLSPEWFDCINASAKRAGEKGTFTWLYDEDKWPSGFAGGEVAKYPEFRGRALVLLTEEKLTENDTVLETVEKDGKTYYIAKRISPMGNKWFNGACYVDLMNPEAVKKFIEVTHEQYKKHCGQYFGKEIKGIFTDEPCYLMHNNYDVPVVPWSDYLPDFFEKRKGYSILPHIKELFFEEGDYRKTRFDFFDSASALFIESFTKQYSKWCDENNLIMTGHMMAEDSLTYQMQWIGNAMPHYEFMHWPGIDKLERAIWQTVTVKQLTSVVEQLDKERCLSEVFGCIGQQSAFRERKWIADWEAVLGVSFVNHHLSLYSMRGERKRDYPANLFYQQGWWSEERAFSDYIGRLSMIAAYGKRDARILVLHPIASTWSEYNPVNRHATIYDEPFKRLTDLLIEENLDFHYGDETIMSRHAKIEEGKVKIGKYEYDTVIVPPSLTLRESTVKLLSEFKGELIYVTPTPTRIEGEVKGGAVKAGAIVLPNVNAAVSRLCEKYKDRVITTDINTRRNARTLICCVKEGEDDKVVLLANTEERREITAEVVITETRTPFILDLASGEILALPYVKEDGKVKIRGRFYPHSSLALIFTDKPINVKEEVKFVDTGVAFFERAEILDFAREINAELLNENVLVLNKVSLTINGEKVMSDEPIAKTWHRYFYSAKDGTPFSAEYRFNVLSVPEGEIYAVIEAAQNLDKITINGNEAKALRRRGEPEVFDPKVNYLDVNFVKVPLTGFVRKGENVLKIEGVKVSNITGVGSHEGVKNFRDYPSTEVETVYIIGNFTVAEVNREEFAIAKGSPKLLCCDITSSGAPFYCGKVLAKGYIDIEADGERKYINVGCNNAAYIKVFINGSCIGSKYTYPFMFEVPQSVYGKCEVAVEFAGTLFNMTGPNWISNILSDRGVGPGTFIHFDRYTERAELLSVGINGINLVSLK